MRTIERATAFRRDYKREAKGKYRQTIQSDLTVVLTALVNDRPLPERNRDHALTGTWAGYRDCHIKPDLVLIYRLPDANTLWLARLGSHSELFTCPELCRLCGRLWRLVWREIHHLPADTVIDRFKCGHEWAYLVLEENPRRIINRSEG